MATIKSFTDLSQSEALSKILSLESADMRFCFSHTLDGRITGHYPMIGREPSLGTIPCWSLAALLSVLPEVSLNTFKDGKWNAMVQHDGKMIYGDKDNPIDACYELILNLHELNLLRL